MAFLWSLLAALSAASQIQAVLCQNCARSSTSSSSPAFSSPNRSAPYHDTCPSTGPLSCSCGSGSTSTSSCSDSCCHEVSNGLFLSTQFWDYNPATGPDNLFTLHGLWSDTCSGSYNTYCNPSWEVTSAQSTLEALGYTSLLSTMDGVWFNNAGTSDDLWTHEFNKHGTCMATVNPSCYSSSAPASQNVGDFFTTAVDMFQQLPTYEWLTAAGYSPSTSTTYDVSEIESVLSAQVGNTKVYLGCDSSNNLQEVWYAFYLTGSVADGVFTPTDNPTSSTCKNGMKWMPKGSSNGGGGGGGDGTTPSGKVTLNVVSTSSPNTLTGCIISDGNWYTTGTCAKFTTANGTTSNSVTLTSSKGPCGIVSDYLQCSSSTTASEFVIDDNGYLNYGGQSTWNAANIPTGTQQTPVSPSGTGSVYCQIQVVPYSS